MPNDKQNKLRLGESTEINENLKPLKVGGVNSPLEISKTELTVRGTVNAQDMYINGVAVITESTDIDGLNDLSDVTYSDGDLTITSLDTIVSGALTIDSSADITLDADGADVLFHDDGAQYAKLSKVINAGSLYLYSTLDSNDFLTISCGTNGVSTIQTSANPDADGAHLSFTINGAIKFTADDAIWFDSEEGHFVFKKDGTEFSVANSAYAGMILGYRMIGEDARTVTYTISSSWEVMDADCTVRFIAPTSGAVEVFVQAGLLDAQSGRLINFGLSDNATYNSIGDTYQQFVNVTDESDQQVIQHHWTITGLTAGTTYNYWFAAHTNTGTSYIHYGGDREFEHPDFIMKVTALPTAVADFAVYG